MARLHQDLPPPDARLFITVIAQEDAEAAFTQLRDAEHTAALHTHYSRYVERVRDAGLGLILESPTGRASHDHGERLGYGSAELELANRQAIALLEAVRAGASHQPLVISACVGPRSEHPASHRRMSITEARRYHTWQVRILADTPADLLCAMGMQTPEEATGIALAARHVQMPLVVAFTVGEDGRLADGHALDEAIEQVDLQTDGYPVYYMIVCRHPAHVHTALPGAHAGGTWHERVRGLLVRSDQDADPQALASHCARLRQSLTRLTIFGGIDPRYLDAQEGG